MPKWHQWIDENNEELIDDYETIQKIPRKKRKDKESERESGKDKNKS